MSLSVFIEDSFDAAHSLPHLPEKHKCHHLHGHTYKVRLEFTGPLVSEGWIVDYGVVKSYWNMVKNRLDHKFINEVVTPSTSEVLCQYIAEELSGLMKRMGPPMVKLSRVELRETERCGCVCALENA